MSAKGSSVIERLKKLHQQTLELDNETNQTVSSNKIRKGTNYRMRKSSAGVAINPLIPAASVPENIVSKKKIKPENDAKSIPTKFDKKLTSYTKVNKTKKADQNKKTEEDTSIQTIPFPTGKTNLTTNPAISEQSKSKSRTINRKIYEKRSDVSTKYKPLKKNVQEKAPEPNFAFEKPVEQRIETPSIKSDDSNDADKSFNEGTFNMNISTNDSIGKKLYNPPQTKYSNTKKSVAMKKAEKQPSIVRYSGFRSKNNQEDEVPSYDFKSKINDSPPSKIRTEQVTEAYTRFAPPRPTQELSNIKDDEFDSSDELIKKAASFLRKAKRIQTNASRNMDSIRTESTITEVKKEKEPFSWGNMLKESINESKVLLNDNSNNQNKGNSPAQSSVKSSNSQDHAKVQLNHHQMIELSSDESDDIKFAFTPPKKPENENPSKQTSLQNNKFGIINQPLESSSENDFEIQDSTNTKPKITKSKIPKMVSKPAKSKESNEVDSIHNSSSIDDFLHLGQAQKEIESDNEEKSSPKDKLMSLMHQKLTNVFNSDSNDVSSSSDVPTIATKTTIQKNTYIHSNDSETDDIIAQIDNKLKETSLIEIKSTNKIDNNEDQTSTPNKSQANDSKQVTSTNKLINVFDDDSSSIEIDSSNKLPKSPIDEFKILRNSVIEVLNNHSDEDVLPPKEKSPLSKQFSPQKEKKIEIDDDLYDLSPVKKQPPQPELYPTGLELNSKNLSNSDSSDEDLPPTKTNYINNSFTPKQIDNDNQNDLSSDSFDELDNSNDNIEVDQTNKQQEIPVPSFALNDDIENKIENEEPIVLNPAQEVQTTPKQNSKTTAPLQLSPTVSVTYFSNKKNDKIAIQQSMINDDEGIDFTNIDMNENSEIEEEEEASDDSFTAKLQFAKNKLSSIREAKQSKLSSSLLNDETDNQVNQSTHEENPNKDNILNTENANLSGDDNLIDEENINKDDNLSKKINQADTSSKNINKDDTLSKNMKIKTEINDTININNQFIIEDKINTKSSEEENSLNEEENEAEELDDTTEEPIDPFFLSDDIFNKESEVDQMIVQEYSPKKNEPQNTTEEMPKNSEQKNEITPNDNYSELQKKLDGINFSLQFQDKIVHINDHDENSKSEDDLAHDEHLSDDEIAHTNSSEDNLSHDTNSPKDNLAHTNSSEDNLAHEINSSDDNLAHDTNSSDDEPFYDKKSPLSKTMTIPNNYNMKNNTQKLFSKSFNQNEMKEFVNGQKNSNEEESEEEDEILIRLTNLTAKMDQSIHNLSKHSDEEDSNNEKPNSNNKPIKAELKDNSIEQNDNSDDDIKNAQEINNDKLDFKSGINSVEIKANPINDSQDDFLKEEQYDEDSNNEFLKNTSLSNESDNDLNQIEEDTYDLTKSSINKNDKEQKPQKSLDSNDVILNKNVDRVDLLNMPTNSLPQENSTSQSTESSHASSKDSFAFEFLKQEDFIGDSFKLRNPTKPTTTNLAQNATSNNSSSIVNSKQNKKVSLSINPNNNSNDLSIDLIQSIETIRNDSSEEEEEDKPKNAESVKDNEKADDNDLAKDILNRIRAFGNRKDEYQDENDSDDEYSKQITKENKQSSAILHSFNNDEEMKNNEDDENGMTQTQIDLDDLSKTEISKFQLENKADDDIDIDEMNVLQSSQKVNILDDLSNSEEEDDIDDEFLNKKIEELINMSLSDDDLSDEDI